MTEPVLQGSTPADRRRLPRTELELPIKYRLQSGPSENSASLRNLSEEGAGLVLPEQWVAGTKLDVDILLAEDAAPLCVRGEVVWQSHLTEHSRGGRFVTGVRFTEVSPPYQSRLAELLRTPWLYVPPAVPAEKRLLLPQIGDSEFDSFAKKAATLIKDSDRNVRPQIEGFFHKDVRQYHEDLSELFQEMASREIKSVEIENRLTTLTDSLLLKGNGLEGTVGNVAMKKIKQMFRELTGRWFYQSPIMKMGYEKPRGYPGDYELFEIIYNGKPLAEERTVGFYFDQYFLNNAYAKAVRTRKNKMKNILQDLMENNTSSRLRIFNVACGPCREIRELLSDPLLSSKANLCFTGLDSDERSLEFSKSALAEAPPNITLRFLNENVLGLFRNNKYYDMIGKQDVIYILGLTEYLPDRIFQKLIRFLSQLLDDKGMLVITYKDKDIPIPSLPPDWLCDWAFIKRSKDDLINAAEGLGLDKYSLRIEKEGTGTIFFLMLTKT